MDNLRKMFCMFCWICRLRLFAITSALEEAATWVARVEGVHMTGIETAGVVSDVENIAADDFSS